LYSPNPIEENVFIFDAGIDDGRDGARPVFTDTTTHNDATDGARPVSTDSAIHHDSADPVLPAEKTTAPVVVKKQIIQRQTVVVRDTILIIE